MYEYIEVTPIKRSEMTCKTCIFGVPRDEFIECRTFPETVIKDPIHWCASGMWRQYSKKLDCNVHYYYHEGSDD